VRPAASRLRRLAVLQCCVGMTTPFGPGMSREESESCIRDHGYGGGRVLRRRNSGANPDAEMTESEFLAWPALLDDGCRLAQS
jgi:hypothetical protein